MRSCRSWCLFRLVLAGILVAAYAAQLVSATVRSQAQMPRQQLFRRQNPFRPRGHQDMFTNPALSPPLNMTLRPRRGPPRKRDVLYTTPLEIVNSCDETIWPGILTQHGVGPGTGGFALEPNETRAMLVSWDWQGRVWGRANCSFNAEGDGPAQPMGVNGWGAACESCDCGGQLDCSVAGVNPCTLFEINLAGGYMQRQTFMDISLVDGYNLPMQVEVIPATNLSIPPNLVNAACIGTAGWLAPPATSGFMGIPNGTYPLPYEPKVTNEEVAKWCPWDLQVKRPEKPGDGVYPYPDDDIKRPVFDPCLSACAAHGKPEDCCQGKYNNPNICKPSLYSKQAKRVCPDAYSFAFDDQTSTFIVPRGSGWRVRFCPRSGRSSNIIQTYAQELGEFGSTGTLRPDALARVMNASYIATRNSVATRAAVFSRSSAALVAVAASVASLFIF